MLYLSHKKPKKNKKTKNLMKCLEHWETYCIVGQCCGAGAALFLAGAGAGKKGRPRLKLQLQL